jgi:tight adherence protein B
MDSILIIGAIAIGMTGLLFGAAMLLGLVGGENDQVESRLESLTSNRGRSDSKVSTEQISSLLRQEAGGFMEEQLKALELGPYVQQSGVNVTVSALLLMSAALFALGFVTVSFFLRGYLLSMLGGGAALAAGAILGALPLLYVWFMRKRRLGKFGDQLIQALDLMSQALRAGQSLPSGIQLVGEQIDEPLGPEFQRAFDEQNLGVALTDTMSDMADRIPNLDLRFLVTAIILQRQTGGDLAEILDKIAHLCRERQQIKGQIQALTGEGRMSGLVLLAL